MPSHLSRDADLLDRAEELLRLAEALLVGRAGFRTSEGAELQGARIERHADELMRLANAIQDDASRMRMQDAQRDARWFELSTPHPKGA